MYGVTLEKQCMNSEKADRGNVMICATYFWETLGSIIHIKGDSIGITNFNIIAIYGHSFILTVFNNGSGNARVI